MPEAAAKDHASDSEWSALWVGPQIFLCSCPLLHPLLAQLLTSLHVPSLVGAAAAPVAAALL